MAPEAHTPLPAQAYCAPERWALEAQHIFGRTWTFAAHRSQLPQDPGALAVRVAGRPLVLVRTPAGQIRAFDNICRHRAGPLLWPNETRSCTKLVCRYHGWQYDLDGGDLVASPGFGADPGQWSLGRVPVAEWRGLFFVWLGTEPPHPLAVDLGDLPSVCAHLDWTDTTLAQTARHDLACNWKVYVENYLEGYHIPHLHPALRAGVRMQDYQVAVHDRVAVHRVPTRDGAPSTGLWAWLWPNLAINFYSGGLSLERMDPTGPTTMALHYTYLFAPGISPAEQQAAIDQSTLLTLEDQRIAEAVQQNLETQRVDPGPLSPRHEAALAAFQGRVRTATGSC